MAFRADLALGQLLENRTVTYGIFGSPDQSVKEGRPDIEHMAVRFTVSEVARTGILDDSLGIASNITPLKQQGLGGPKLGRSTPISKVDLVF